MRRLAASLLLIGALTVPLTGCGREARHQVRLSVEQISSIAAEGSLIADDVARDPSKTTFVRVQGEELSSQAQHEAEKLNDAIFTKIAGIVKRRKYGTHQEMRSQDSENRRVVAFDTTPAAVDDAVYVG